MTRFTADNTEGYTQEQLNAMNAEFEARCNSVAVADIRDSFHRANVKQRIAEDVCCWMDAQLENIVTLR